MKSFFLFLSSVAICVSAQASTSEQFFTAYQVAQISGLSKILANQARNQKMIEETANILLNQSTKTSGQDTAKQQQAYQNTVSNFVNSKRAEEYFDSLATELLANTYNYEELKALYQLYNTDAVQKFLPNEVFFITQQNMQTYLSRKVMNKQLEDKSKELLENVKLEEETSPQNQPSKEPTTNTAETKIPSEATVEKTNQQVESSNKGDAKKE